MVAFAAVLSAALLGARELIGPVIAMTITLAAVYAPELLAALQEIIARCTSQHSSIKQSANKNEPV